jgi:hypothetical protein
VILDLFSGEYGSFAASLELLVLSWVLPLFELAVTSSILTPQAKSQATIDQSPRRDLIQLVNFGWTHFLSRYRTHGRSSPGYRARSEASPFRLCIALIRCNYLRLDLQNHQVRGGSWN